MVNFTEIPRRNIFPSISPKAGENFDETFISLALFCHFAYIFTAPNLTYFFELDFLFAVEDVGGNTAGNQHNP